MKQFLKNNWKIFLIIFIIIFGFIFYYEILPKYNLMLANIGYDGCVNYLKNAKAFPFEIPQGNQTQITFVSICSQSFIDNYQNICGKQI